MRKFYHKIISCILIFTILFSNFKVTEVQAAENQSFSEILKDRLGITSYENQKKMMKDTFNSLLESIGISYDDKNQLEEDFQDTLDMMKLNIQEWYDFCYDFTIRKLFQGKTNIDELVNKKVIKDNKTFGELYNRFSNIIFNTLNKKYYYLKKDLSEIENYNYDYKFDHTKANDRNLIYKGDVDLPYGYFSKQARYSFSIVDVDTFKITSDELKAKQPLLKESKFNFNVQILPRWVSEKYNKIYDFEIEAKILAEHFIDNQDYNGTSSGYSNEYRVPIHSFDTYDENKGNSLKDFKLFERDLFTYVARNNAKESGFFTNELIVNIFKCEYIVPRRNKVACFYFGDITNDYNLLKDKLNNFGLWTDYKLYLEGTNFYVKDLISKVKNVKPLNAQYVMRPYNINYYNQPLNNTIDKSNLLASITDLLNDHLNNLNLNKKLDDGLNTLKSNYDYYSATITDNQVKLSNQLTNLQDNFNAEYNYLNDLLNDFIDNKYRKQQQELSDKLDKLTQNVDNNKLILQENNKVLKSYDSELKGISENLQVLSLNSDNNYKSLSKKVDDIYNKLNNLGDISNPKSDIDLSEIKRLNDRIKEINETDPKDRIGDSISMLDRFIDFVKNFFTVNEKIEIQKLDTLELSKKFPFSIFTDIKNIFQSLVKPPKVPIFEFPLFTEKIVLDFNNFQELAAIIRTFTLLTFIVAIALKMNNKAG